MKTIEEIACERYIADQSKPKQQQIPAQNYIQWAEFGAQEAQRWIDIYEELPPHNEVVLCKISRIDHPLLFVYNHITQRWYELKNREEYHQLDIPISWRPIERK